MTMMRLLLLADVDGFGNLCCCALLCGCFLGTHSGNALVIRFLVQMSDCRALSNGQTFFLYASTLFFPVKLMALPKLALLDVEMTEKHKAPIRNNIQPGSNLNFT